MSSSGLPANALCSHRSRVRCVSYLLASTMLIAIYAGSPNFKVLPIEEQGLLAGDFLQEWIGGYIVRSGLSARLYDQSFADGLEHTPAIVGFSWDRGEYLPMVYPPFWYAIVSPLAALPYSIAAGLWAALMTFSVVISCVLIRPWIRAETHWATVVSFLVLPTAIFFPPVIENLTSGQKGGLCLLLFVATSCLLEQKRSFVAGLLFGLMLFKPQFTLVLLPVMMARRDVRFVAGFAVTGLALLNVSLGMGSGLCVEYLRFLTRASEYLNSSGYALTKSHSAYGAIALLGGGITTPVRWITATVIAAVLGRTIWFAIRQDNVSQGSSMKGDSHAISRPLAVELAGAVLATLLVTPHLYTYDLTILLFPCASLLRSDVLAWLGNMRRWAAWNAMTLLAVAGVSPLIAAQTGLQLTTILIGSLWLCLTASHFTNRVACLSKDSDAATMPLATTAVV